MSSGSRGGPLAPLFSTKLMPPKKLFWDWPLPLLSEGLDRPLVFNAIHVLKWNNVVCLLFPVRVWYVSIQRAFCRYKYKWKDGLPWFHSHWHLQNSLLAAISLNTHIHTVSHPLTDFWEKETLLAVYINTHNDISFSKLIIMLLISNILWPWAYENLVKVAHSLCIYTL